MKMFRIDAADSGGISENWEQNYLPLEEGFSLMTINSHAYVYYEGVIL